MIYQYLWTNLLTRDEEEMVINKLLADTLFHTSQGIVATGQISFQLSESILHEGLNINTLLLGDSGGKTESLDGTSNTDSRFKISNNVNSSYMTD